MQITAQLAGSLAPEREGELNAHLRACAACARFMREQLEIDRLVESSLLELEPPARIWSRIEAEINTSHPSVWERVARSFFELFSLPELRHALAGLVLLAVLSTSLLYLPGSFDRSLLSELDSYRVAASSSNPFLLEQLPRNPFFEKESQEGNPFEHNRSQR